MATASNRLARHEFDGAGYPSFAVPWPGFDWPSATGVNLTGYSRPVVDGQGNGIPSRAIGGVTWRARSDYRPGLSALQVDLWAKWANAGFAGRREVGLVARFYGPQDVLVARVRSMGTASPELRLFSVVGGVETQLGATYTGAGLSASTLNAGLAWRVRVEDLTDGSGLSSVKVYLNPAGASGKGTLVLSWTGDLGILRGALPVGIELRDQVFGTDVRVDNLTVWDLSDEWNPSGPPPSPGSGWQVMIGTRLYSLPELAELEPPVSLVSVQHGYGPKGNQVRLRVGGDYRMGSLLFPGQYVEALYDGAVMFRGWVADGELAASPQEGQTWNAFDGSWSARQVLLLTDRKTPTLFWNVTDKRSDEYDPEEQDRTMGQVALQLFDRYLTQLRAVGAAPPDGLPYVSGEWAALAAVKPDLSLSGTFPAALDTLLRYLAHRYQLWFDPAGRVWHLVDITNPTPEVVECSAEWVTLKAQPDRDRSYTAVEWIGTAQEQDANITLSTKDGTLKPAWTKEQENRYGKDKRNRSAGTGTILSAGTALAPDGVLRPYFDVAAGLYEEDDFRGAIGSVDGDAFQRFVVKNTATRFWLSAPSWGGGVPPSPGSRYFVTLVDAEAMEELSAAGVGRGYVLLPPTEVCGYPSAAAAGLKFGGFCGTARAWAEGDGGAQLWSEAYTFRVRVPTAAQQAAGFCDTTLVMAEKPKPPMGLINFLPPKGGSPPTGECQPGPSNQASQVPQVYVEVSIPALKATAPYFREPPVGYHGPAFSEDPTRWDGGGGPAGDDWGCVQVYQVVDQDFTAQDQDVGLRLAAQDILAVKGQKAWLFDVQLATPFRAAPPEAPTAAAVNRWAGLGKAIRITSTKRATGFELVDHLMVLRVTWRPEENVTQLEAGTAAGWLSVNGVDVREAYANRAVVRKVQGELKRAVDAINTAMAKNLDRVGHESGAPTDACSTTITNQQVKRTTTVEKDDADKVENITHLAHRMNVLEDLLLGQQDEHPGTPISVPGLTDAPSQLALDEGAEVLRAPVSHRVPFQGPTDEPNAARGTYGGVTGTENPNAGKAPDVLLRRGGLLFQKALAPDGTRAGGAAAEVSATDQKGAAAGAFTRFTSPLVLPTGRAPLRMAGAGGLLRQLLQRTEDLAADLGRRSDAITKELLTPGRTATGYPDGVPAGLLDAVRATGLFGGFQLVPESIVDPGGPVWWGPVNRDGVDAKSYWRLAAPESLLLRVTNVGAPAGTNGGAWSWDTSGPGGSYEFLSAGRVVHKQAHSGDMEVDPRFPGVPSLVAADPKNPFGVTGKAWRFNALQPSGLVCAIAAPDYARGIPVFFATVKELTPPTRPAGQTYVFRIDHAYQASPWTAITAGTAKVGLTTDGTGTGTGQFKQPGGAVPAGLRVPSDSIAHLWAGSAPPGGANGPMLAGAGYEIAQVEGGYLIRLSQAGAVQDAWDLNRRAHRERGAAVDEWAVCLIKRLEEAGVAVDSWNPQLNPPVELFEGGAGHDLWTTLLF